MATTLPSGQLGISQVQGAYGGSNPISMSEYYRGGSYVDAAVASPGIPTSGQISMSQFRGTTAWVRAYLTIGDITNGQIYGAHTTSGGNASSTLLYDMNGNYNPDGGWWLSDGSTASTQVTTSGSLINLWYPLVPSLYSKVGGSINSKSRYALGTCDVSPVADVNSTFCWKHPNSSWTTSAIRDLLGFSSTQASNVKMATQVWWNYALAGMDSNMCGGFMIFNYNTYSSSGAQACYNGATKMYLARVNDAGGEWQQQGWQFAPTVTGITVTNTGVTTTSTLDPYGRVTGYTYSYSCRSWIGATGRSSNADLGINEEENTNLRSDITWQLSTTDLVVPMMKSDNGFSGGAWNGARNPLVARFGYIGVT